MVGFSQFPALTNWQGACWGMLEAVAALGSMQNGCRRGTTLCFLVPFHISPMSHQAYSFSNNASPKAALLASLTRFTMNRGDVPRFFFSFSFSSSLWDTGKVSQAGRRGIPRDMCWVSSGKSPGTFYQTLQMCSPQTAACAIALRAQTNSWALQCRQVGGFWDDEKKKMNNWGNSLFPGPWGSRSLSAEVRGETDVCLTD